MKVDVDLSDVSLELPITEPKKEMLSITVDPESGRTSVRINSSSLALIQECLRKSMYTLREGRRPMTEPPAPLFGKAVHKFMETYYTGNVEERSVPPLKDVELMAYGHKVLGEETDLVLRAIRAFIEEAKPLAALPESDARSIQNGAWLLWLYTKDYVKDPYVAFRDEKGPFIERDFTLRIYEDPKIMIDYFGRVDLVLQNHLSKEIHVTDHKTSSRMGSDFYNRLKPNHQYTGYLLGAREIFKIDTSSFLVNGIEVKAKPKKETSKLPSNIRQVTSRDENDFKEFKEAVVDSVFRYLHALETDKWPMGHVNACAMYNGCGYLSVCSAPAHMRENILKAKYTKG